MIGAKLKVIYLDGTTETVTYYGYPSTLNGSLSIDLDGSSYGPLKRRHWPLASIRSWEDA